MELETELMQLKRMNNIQPLKPKCLNSKAETNYECYRLEIQNAYFIHLQVLDCIDVPYFKEQLRFKQSL